MKEQNRILIVEDELITAASIIELLEEEEYTITGPAKTAAEALAICENMETPPLIALCDINIKGPINGTELAVELKKRYQCEIIFLTAYTDQKSLKDAFSSEPVMYVVKPYSDTQLLVAIQMAFHKLLVKENKETTKNLELTKRETEIAQLVAEGMSTKQIASRLSISVETVKTHRRRMLQKNNINSFPHLVYLMNREI